MRDAGPAAATLPCTIHAIPHTTPIAMNTLGINVSVSGDGTFTVTPSAGNWNAVGLVGPATTNWDVYAGSGESQRTAGFGDFIVADGHAGAITPTQGLHRRRFGTSAATLQLAPVATIQFFTQNVVNFGFNFVTNLDEVIELRQFNVTAPGDHALTLSGVAASWALFAPQSNARWLSRSDALATGSVNGSTTTVNLPATGVYALVLHGDAAAPSGSVLVTIVPPSPGPVLNSINPTSTTVGLGAVPMTLNGGGFVQTSSVRFGNTAVTTSFVSSTQLTANIPAGLLANAGIVPVTVVTPAPGGGTSQAINFTINSPVPSLQSVAPANVSAGGAQFNLTCTGLGFTAQSVVRWNGTNLTTGFTSSTQLVATVPASLIDGLGVFGPPSLISFTFDPASTPPGGVFLIPGVTQPNPPAGIAVTDQFFYLDPSHPTGFRFSHGLRYPL